MKKDLIIKLILLFVLTTSLIVIYVRQSKINILPTDNNIILEEPKEKISESNTLEVESIIPSENIETSEIETEVEDIVPSTEKVIENHNASKQTTSTTSSHTSSPTPSSPPIVQNTPTKVEEKEEIKVDETIEKKQEESNSQSAPLKTDETSKVETPKVETPPAEINQEIKRCTDADNHGIEVGNTGKWFSTKDEAIAYYKSEIKKWSDEWEAANPDDAEANKRYYENCPTGYNVFSCMYCSKWTINFYYRK